jgi:phosphopentomutase
MYKRIFLIVLDSLGIGEAPDADKYGDIAQTPSAISLKNGFRNTQFKILWLWEYCAY